MHDIFLTKTLELCWIPSHAGILGNEEADVNAKRASLQAAQPIGLQYWLVLRVLKRVLVPFSEKKIHEKWMRSLRVIPSKLCGLCDTPMFSPKLTT